MNNQFAAQNPSIRLQFRCLQAVHKASGKVLDNSCDLALTRASWSFLQHEAEGKYITMDDNVLPPEDVERLHAAGHRTDVLFCSPKPDRAAMGTGRTDVQYMVNQLEWRVFHAELLLHVQYYPSGRVKHHVITLMDCQHTGEVLQSAGLFRGVYEPLQLLVDEDQAVVQRREVLNDHDQLMYIDLPVAEARSAITGESSGRTIVERYINLRAIDATARLAARGSNAGTKSAATDWGTPP